VIVFHLLLGLKEVAIVAELVGRLPDECDQPIRRAALALNVQALVADHVGQDECLDAAQGSVLAPFGCQMARAVGGVGCVQVG